MTKFGWALVKSSVNRFAALLLVGGRCLCNPDLVIGETVVRPRRRAQACKPLPSGAAEARGATIARSTVYLMRSRSIIVNRA